MFRHLSSRQPLPCWLSWLPLFFILSCCTPSGNTSNPEIFHFVDTWNDIHLFQTFDYNISNPADVAKRYDFVWGADQDHIAAFRSGNPNIFVSYYLPFNRDNGMLSGSNSLNDLAHWRVVHPDWVLYKCDRITPAYEFGDPNIPLDFANPAVISWQIQTYAKPASASGYDGIAADNVNFENLFGACGVYIHGKWMQRYSGQINDLQWRADVLTWLTRMQQALHSLQHPLALIANLDLGNLALSDPKVQQIVSHLDGVVDESGFTDYSTGYLTGSKWVQRIEFIISVQEHRKAYYIINQFPSVGRREIQWALASYLMSKEHTSSLFISTPQGYGTVSWYNEYNAPIGSPIGPMYQAQHIYWRNYSNGLSLVNPSATETYTITLNPASHYIDLYDTPVSQSIIIPPHSGMVLLVEVPPHRDIPRKLTDDTLVCDMLASRVESQK